MDYDKLLDRLYYKEHNYDGVETLYRKAKAQDKTITKSFVKEWLSNQATQQQTKQDTKKKIYKPIYSESHYAYQIDLTFLDKYKKSNDGNYVLFTAININSRYAYAYYSKTKDTKCYDLSTSHVFSTPFYLRILLLICIDHIYLHNSLVLTFA